MKDPFNTARPRSVFMAAGLFLCVAILTTATFGQDEPIRVDTDFVTIPVTVLDRQGRYVPGLAQSDFTIFEDGARQSIALFERSERPVTVLLLLDTSGSMNNYSDRNWPVPRRCL